MSELRNDMELRKTIRETIESACTEQASDVMARVATDLGLASTGQTPNMDRVIDRCIDDIFDAIKDKL